MDENFERLDDLLNPDSEVRCLVNDLIEARNEQRQHIFAAIDGLSDEQVARPVLPSGWSCLGMLKHLALADEHYWFRSIIGGQPLDGFPRGTERRLDHRQGRDGGDHLRAVPKRDR